MLFNADIATIRNRLKLTMAYNSQGGNVSNLDLDYINRAKDWLCQYRMWDFLIKYQTATVPDTRIVALPADLQTLVEVYIDINGDGKPDLWFYANSPDVMNRYVLIPTYDPATGETMSIQFPPNAYLTTTPTLKYVFKVADYTRTGTEYSFFTPGLLLRTAQKIYVEDRGIDDAKGKFILSGFSEELRLYEQMVMYNNQEMDLTVKNRYGVPIKLYGQSLDGGTGRANPYPYLPSAAFYTGPY